MAVIELYDPGKLLYFPSDLVESLPTFQPRVTFSGGPAQTTQSLLSQQGHHLPWVHDGWSPLLSPGSGPHPHEGGRAVTFMPIVQSRSLRPREVMCFFQGHRGGVSGRIWMISVLRSPVPAPVTAVSGCSWEAREGRA